MNNQKDLLVIGVVTFITVFAWILFDIYHAVVTSQITQVQAKLITPLNPEFDQTTIDMVRQRQQ